MQAIPDVDQRHITEGYQKISENCHIYTERKPQLTQGVIKEFLRDVGIAFSGIDAIAAFSVVDTVFGASELFNRESRQTLFLQQLYADPQRWPFYSAREQAIDDLVRIEALTPVFADLFRRRS